MTSPFVEPPLPGSLLARILDSVGEEISAARAAVSATELQRQLADAPPVRSLTTALRAQEFSLIAEIKRRSPSQGAMRPENVADAADAYAQSSTVAAISVLTNHAWFGNTIADLAAVRRQTGKPILRKEFILDPYQILEARAAGADAILLMANVLTARGLDELSQLATELKLETLFEVHTAAEIAKLPVTSAICGINSRTFAADASTRYAAAQTARAAGHAADLSTDLDRFSLIESLPPSALKIAESGLTPRNIAHARDHWHFDAGLIGTSLLLDPAGVHAALAQFTAALTKPTPTADFPRVSRPH